MKTGVLLLGHGSRSAAANSGLQDLAGQVEAGLGRPVRPAYFQFGKPSLEEVVAGMVQDGYDRIVIVPAFLFPGMHLQHDIPEVIDGMRQKYGDKVQFVVTPCLGAEPRLAEILVERVRKTGLLHQVSGEVRPEITEPGAITARSRHLIEESLGEAYFQERFGHLEGEVVRRVVHAMGNPEIASLMRFHPEAITAGLAALRRGATIFTDVRMVKVGINRTALCQMGGRAICLIHHPRVRELAARSGETRALTAFRNFRQLWKDQIVVVGNAPTALMEVLRQCQEGFRPALIVGTAVGFVGAAESKARLVSQQQVPYIALIGNQGGSTAAVAVINALIALAQGRAGL